MRETEIKLPVLDAPAMRRRLRKHGFAVVAPRLFERNLVFDSPQLTLRRGGRLLRLRSRGGRWWVTWKSRPLVFTRHKVREEIEFETPDGPQAAAVFQRLGYLPVFEYQKYRAEYQRPGERGKVVLDQTPIGDYLELEGPPRWIDRVASELGFRSSDYIIESYGALYLDWCRDRNLTPSQMLFPGKKSLRPKLASGHSGE